MASAGRIAAGYLVLITCFGWWAVGFTAIHIVLLILSKL